MSRTSSADRPSALALPDKPSLAVLPFRTHSERDDDARTFAEGVSEHLTYAFACTPGLFVAGRSSAFSFRARTIDPAAIGRALGVAHVLEGLITRDEGRLAIEARLSGTRGEGVTWSREFHGPEDALFDHLAALVEAVVGALAPDLPVDREQVRRRTRFPGDLDLYARFLAAYADHIPRTAESTHLLQQSLADLIRIMPGEPLPLALAAQSIVNAQLQGWSADPEADKALGLAHARAALALPAAQDSAAVLTMAAYPLAFLGRDYRTALGLFARSLAINPNSAATHERSGWVRLYLGEPGPAIMHFHRAKRLSPLDVTSYRFDAGLGFGHCLSGEHEAAVAWLHRAIAAMPFYTTSYRALAASLAHLGRLEEARDAVRTLLARDPGCRIAQTLAAYPASAALDLYVAGLRKAGLPD